VVRLGRVPRVLRAHFRMIGLCNLRNESTQSHDGEQARADRTRHAEAGGSPSPTCLALNRTALRPAPRGYIARAMANAFA